jgi:hypothetical protein
MAVHRVDSQVTVILNHLNTFKEINPLEAFSKYGVYRLGAVIGILRDEGYNISTRLYNYKKPSGKRGRYAIYRLEE